MSEAPVGVRSSLDGAPASADSRNSFLSRELPDCSGVLDTRIEDLTPIPSDPDPFALRIAIDRCLGILRREMRPVMPRFRELYPSASRYASPP